MTRPRIAIAVAVLLLAGGWWIVASWRAAPGHDAPTVESAAEPIVPVGTTSTAPSAAAARGAATEAAPPTRTSASLPSVPSEPGVRVRVVRQDGRPVAGVAVELRASLAGHSDDGEVAEARTDADGLATLAAKPEWAERMAMLEKMGQAKLDLAFAVVAEVTLPDAPRVVLGSEPRVEGTVELRLPPFGSLVVQVRDALGAPVGEGMVYLFWRAPGSGGGWERTGIPHAAVHAGEAHFALVPVGRELCLRPSASRSLQSGPDEVVPGPSRDGDVVTATVRYGAPWPHVVGTLLDESARPVTGQVSMALALVPLDAPPEFVPERKDASWRWEAVDAQGRFRVRASETAPAGKRRLLLVEQAVEGSEVVRATRADVPGVLPSGQDVDVGTLVLAPRAAERVLCAGRVVDAQGHGIAGAGVSAGHWDREAGRWVRLHQQNVRADGEGRFVVRSAADVPQTFLVSASVHGLVPAQVDGREGQQDLVLVLRRGGKLHARIAAPKGVPAHLLVGRIVDAQGRSREPNQFAGAFGADGLAPGRYEVVVRIAQSNWEIARVRGIEVRADEAVDDERLAPIDVAGTCRALRLRLVDAARQPIGGTKLRVEDETGRGLQVETDADGRVLVVVPATAATFRLRLADGRTATAGALDDEQLVILPD